MLWLGHFSLFLVGVTALFSSAAAKAFALAPDGSAQGHVGVFELVPATLVGPPSSATSATALRHSACLTCAPQIHHGPSRVQVS